MVDYILTFIVGALVPIILYLFVKKDNKNKQKRKTYGEIEKAISKLRKIDPLFIEKYNGLEAELSDVEKKIKALSNELNESLPKANIPESELKEISDQIDKARARAEIDYEKLNKTVKEFYYNINETPHKNRCSDPVKTHLNEFMSYILNVVFPTLNKKPKHIFLPSVIVDLIEKGMKVQRAMHDELP